MRETKQDMGFRSRPLGMEKKNPYRSLNRRDVLKAISAIPAGALIMPRALLPVSGAGGPWFEDITLTAGVNARHTHREAQSPDAKSLARYAALAVSSAVSNYAGDGFEDILVTECKGNARK